MKWIAKAWRQFCCLVFGHAFESSRGVAVVRYDGKTVRARCIHCEQWMPRP